MKREASLSLSIAVACLFLSPALIQAKAVNSATSSSSAVPPVMGTREASMMVPANASLLTEINAQKVQPGHVFRARLTDTVHLKNGQKLPNGTLLWGKVTSDKMQPDGRPTLALKFVRAQLKNGKQIPIHVAIMGIGGAPSYGFSNSASAPIPWNGKTLQLDQVGAISGVDLHSKIAGANSGVFVAKKNDHVKLPRGSQLALAIAEQSKKS
ncbi:MAG: hypothetical protein KGN79_03410 [Acidobacteriota bacterium]|nr:hypothetical protein [Acidobacteriota bacterium]